MQKLNPTEAKRRQDECKRVYRNLYSHKIREYKFRIRYGITTEIYNDLKTFQDESCAICKEQKKLYVDHCHATGKVRGLLCQHCNTGLGMFKDKPERMKQALIYLNSRSE